jgi:hypothetical protein
MLAKLVLQDHHGTHKLKLAQQQLFQDHNANAMRSTALSKEDV